MGARERRGRSRSRRRSIGSCTNSSYEDITRAASIARQASAQGPAGEDAAAVTPGLRAGPRHDRARRPARRPRGHRRRRCSPTPAGRASASGTAPTCDPSKRQHDRQLATTATSRSATTATPTRKRSSRRPTRSSRYALAGTLDFDPLTDTITNDDGVACARAAGRRGPARQGLRPGRERVRRAARRRRRPSTSSSTRTATRLQLLEPFPAWDGKDFVDLPVLMKAKGKCTTDHISAAGKWLQYRGHLENISGNLFLGVVNAFTGADRRGQGPARRRDTAVPRHRQALRRGRRRVVRGRRRELRRGLVTRARGDGAAVPRRRGDLRPQLRPHPRDQPEEAGLLPLTFADPATYDQIGEDDRISVLGLASPRARHAGAVPDHQARRLDDRLRVHPHVQRRADRVVQGRQRAQHHPGPQELRRRRSAPPGCATHRLSSAASGAGRSEADDGDETTQSVPGRLVVSARRVALVARRVGEAQLLGRRLVVLARLGAAAASMIASMIRSVSLSTFLYLSSTGGPTRTRIVGGLVTFSMFGSRALRGHTFSVPHSPTGMTGARVSVREPGRAPAALEHGIEERRAHAGSCPAA